MKILLIISFFLVPCISIANTIVVGPNQTVNTLSKADSLAKAGDTIRLKSGVYKEGNILISRSITLIGEGKVVLDGENKNELLTISGRRILIKNIQFRNAGYSALNDFAAIKVIDAGDITIEN